MTDLRRASELFEDRVDRDDYFDAASAELTRTTLLELIDAKERKPLFLLGDPGVGKTKMLHTLKSNLAEKGDERLLIHLHEPFFSPKAFLQKLFDEAGLPEEGSLDALKERAVAHFGAREHLVMIDEAQLMDEKALEFLRILSDTKAFRFLLSMHREEGEEILRKPHFKSRSHTAVRMGRLDRAEVEEYLSKTLLREGLGEVAAMVDKKTSTRIHRYSEGTFRNVKRMAQVLFDLMDDARGRGLKAFRRPNACLIDMAAIELGYLDG